MDADSTGADTTARIDAWLLNFVACLPACHVTRVSLYASVQSAHRVALSEFEWLTHIAFQWDFADLSLCRHIALSPRKHAVGVLTLSSDLRTMSAPSMQGQSRLSRNLDPVPGCELFSSKDLMFWFETILIWNKELQRLWNIIHWNASHHCPGRTGG